MIFKYLNSGEVNSMMKAREPTEKIKIEKNIGQNAIFYFYKYVFLNYLNKIISQ